MMTAPAILESKDLYLARTWPTSVEIAPRVMKTMLNPMMKAAELNMTLRKSSPSFIFSCSTPTPEMRETYPGTSGSTQGDRNEIRPATKAASGNGKLVIELYCSDPIVTTNGRKLHFDYEMLETGIATGISAFVSLALLHDLGFCDRFGAGGPSGGVMVSGGA